MSHFRKSDTANADAKEQWIPYRENGEVKYMRADADEAKDFTSTGGPAKRGKTSAWGNIPSGPFTANAPQFLPERYTDDSVVPVVVMNVVPSMKPEVKEKKSFMNTFKKDKEPSSTRVVFMPRREYKKYFAKDKEGKYIGTEPQKEWTEEELKDEFGQYQKKH